MFLAAHGPARPGQRQAPARRPARSRPGQPYLMESNMNKIAHGQLTRWQDARSWAEGALARARALQSRQGLLGIYLNDHLAGATGGVELAHRMADSHHDPAQRMTLQRLAADIAHDRRALLE